MSSPKLNELLFLTAPNFKDPDYILSYVSVWPLVINIIAAFFCLMCSAVYHLMSVKSPTLNAILARLDYGGIAALVFGTSFTVINYSFACDEVVTAQITFTSIMGIGSIVTLIVIVMPCTQGSNYNPLRASLFVALGLSSICIFFYLAVYKN